MVRVLLGFMDKLFLSGLPNMSSHHGRRCSAKRWLAVSFAALACGMSIAGHGALK
jgi:hypothetical protein